MTISKVQKRFIVNPSKIFGNRLYISRFYTKTGYPYFKHQDIPHSIILSCKNFFSPFPVPRLHEDEFHEDMFWIVFTTPYPLLGKEGVKGIRVKLRNNNQYLIRVESVMSPAGGGAGGGLDFFIASTTPSLWIRIFILNPTADSPFIA